MLWSAEQLEEEGFSYIAGSSFVFMKLFGFTTTEYGWIFGVNSFGIIIASQINRILLRKHSSARILLASVIIQSFASAVLAVGTLMGFLNVVATVSLIFCFVFCVGFNYSNSTALALGHSPEMRGQHRR
jgi:MFS transporter, DHA1 family, multidrug resistance protein